MIFLGYCGLEVKKLADAGAPVRKMLLCILVNFLVMRKMRATGIFDLAWRLRRAHG
jgi:hypothetical protein